MAANDANDVDMPIVRKYSGMQYKLIISVKDAWRR